MQISSSSASTPNSGPASGLPRARVVLGRGSATRRFEATAQRGLTPFIGRGEIIDFLTDFLDGAHPAPRRCALIVGGPGLGKTRLLEEVLGQYDSRAFRLLRGSCESYVGAEVLQPFLQMLRAFFEIQPDTPNVEAARLPAPPSPNWGRALN